MTHKVWKALIAAGVVGVFAWLVWNRETTEWFDTVSNRFTGRWILVGHIYDGGNGTRSIGISPRTIVLHEVVDDGEQELTHSLPVKKVSLTCTPGSDAVRMVVFCGPVAEGTIAERRLEIQFGPKQKIFVQEIVPTGWGEDRWFDVGEFVKTD